MIVVLYIVPYLLIGTTVVRLKGVWEWTRVVCTRYTQFVHYCGILGALLISTYNGAHKVRNLIHYIAWNPIVIM